MHDPAYLQQLGLLVVNSGLAESSLRGTILTICRKNLPLAKRLVLPQSSMSQKLELLRRLIHSEFSEDEKAGWVDLEVELSSLFKFRNQIIHGIPGVSDGEVIVSHIKKGKAEDRWSQKKILIKDLVDFNEKLSDRHRQMMDFIEDYPTGGLDSLKESPKSQQRYPRLKHELA